MSGKFALIIGNTEYTDPGLAQLTAPGKDVEDFARVLRDQDICAFDDVKVLLNQLSFTLIEAIDEFFDQKRPDDLLVLFFSGHGVRDEQGSLYLAVRNTIRSRLRSTAIKSDYIREVMDQSRSRRQVLILDCCNSGAFTQGTKAAVGGTMGMVAALQGYGRYVLTATDATQFAWEGDKIIGETDNSLFTHFLVKGLEGEADSDGDGRITVDELYDYAFDQIVTVTPKQKPNKSATKQEGEIILREFTRLEDIKPLDLPDDLISEIEDLRPLVREGAVQRLAKILNGKNIGLRRSAIEALQKIVEDENTTRRVAQLAAQALEAHRQVELRAEAERRAKEEVERLALEKAEAETKAKEEVEKLARARAEREAAEREAMRLKAEREATEKAAEKAAREKAEKEAADHEAALQAELEAAKLASRKRTEREAAEKAEREAIELAARSKAERQAKEGVVTRDRKVARPLWFMPSIMGVALIALLLCVYGATRLYSAMFGGGGLALPTQLPATENPTKPSDSGIQPVATEENTAIPFFGDKVEATDCTYGGEFKSIEALDTNIVKFTLCYPDPAFMTKIAFPVFGIQDKDYLDSYGGDSMRMSEMPNGTGPYVVKEWVGGDHLTFEANPNYWGGTPANNSLIFRWSDDAAQRLVELQSGSVDGILAPAQEDYQAIQADSNLTVIPYKTINVFYLGMNNTMQPFDNEKVRQAVAMSIDKQRIVDRFYPAGSTIADQFIPEELSPGFSVAGDGAKWYPYDPEAARALLAEAGFPDGFDVTLTYRDVVRVYLANAYSVAQEIQDQFRQVGINVTLNKMDSGTFLDSFSKGQQTFFLSGWGMDYPDADNFYSFHFASGSTRFGNEFPGIAEEVRIAAQLSNPTERQTHYDTANALIKLHVPVVPIAHGAAADAFSRRVGKVVIGPLSLTFSQMTTPSGELVWMQGYEPISLWCGDEADSETLLACSQIYDTLVTYESGGVKIIPSLAESWEVNSDATEWTFHLRPGVEFSNGATLDANDVVATFSALWDAKDPNHKGNSGSFEYQSGFFGAFLNATP